jgi:hypothetical protein
MAMQAFSAQAGVVIFRRVARSLSCDAEVLSGINIQLEWGLPPATNGNSTEDIGMRGSLNRALALVAAAVVASGGSDLAGQIREQNLTEPVESFPQEFSLLGGVLELPDGRVMVADPLGQALAVLDMSAGTADTLGRVGGGPEEYRQPDAVHRMPGDSILLVDLGNGRLTVLGPDLSFGETTPIALGSPMSGNMMIRMPQGVDSQGRVYFQRMMGRMRPDGQMADSAPVFRWDRATGAVDTLAMVKLDEVEVRRSGSGNNQSVDMSSVPMSHRDGWAVGWDGRLVVARSGDYHIDWIDPDGMTVSGPPVEFDPVRIRTPEKEDYVDGLASSGMSISVQNVNGQITTAFGRGGRSTRRELDAYNWPDEMPAFKANRIRIAPDGTAWVERYVSAGSRPVFDLFDMGGVLVQRVTLPAGRRIVGFGDGAVYAAYEDELDLQWLEKYSLQ